MSDDLVDAAQKAINDAAAGVISGSTPPAAPAVPPEPPAPPVPPEPEPSVPPEPAPVPPAPEPPTPEPVTPPVPSMPEPVAPPPSPVTPPVQEQQPATTPAQSGEQIMSDLLNTPTVPGVPVVPPAKHDKPSGPLPTKKGGKGGLIAVIAALLLTLPVAVYYLSQQNQQIADIRNRATGTTYSCSNPPSGIGCTDTGCTVGNYHTTTQTNADQCQVLRYHCDGVKPSGVGCQDAQTGNGKSLDFQENCGTEQIDIICPNQGITNPGCYTGNSHKKTWVSRRYANACSHEDGGTTTPVCQNIKIYKGGTQVTPSTLKAGDAVVLAVKGNLSPAKAHFRINGGTWSETTTKNGSGEFTLNYTIPDGITDFVIEGEVFTDGAWH